MLISFSVENWMSFKDKAEFSMVASLERQHGDRIPVFEPHKLRLLPITAIYGGNASGKTNLFKAVNFARKLIVRGTQPDSRIDVKPFLLDPKCRTAQTRFIFELGIGNRCYEFGFSVTEKEIVEEWLIEILKTTETELYRRENGEIEFGPKQFKDNMFLKFAGQGTRENQLFLTNAVNQKVDDFKPIYDWFKNDLMLIAPDSRFKVGGLMMRREDPLEKYINERLEDLDTGIKRLSSRGIPFKEIPFLEPIEQDLEEMITEEKDIQIDQRGTNEKYLITRKEGKLHVKKLITYHVDTQGNQVEFALKYESDGTLRLIDLLPAIYMLSVSDSHKVFMVDELDRSLHTLLIRTMLEDYLEACGPSTRSQLIFTTHDVALMDQKLFRRDEMTVTERNHDGSTELISLGEYKDLRIDKKIRKDYLLGRLGGIPRIVTTGHSSLNKNESSGREHK